ncbi:MAG TPA: hypothetical protein VFQ61_18400 [Polyangiaceae bacterium]|nr:hypothetical protein [Polyangiaceae bacterium]
MENPSSVALDLASRTDVPILANLLELYIHDICDLFPKVELGEDGRFGYPKLASYFGAAESGTNGGRFAYLIRHGGRLAGFALATRGSPVSPDPAVFDVAEFFVVRKYRRLGVGYGAAALLWSAWPGTWTVRVSEGNMRGLGFWDSAIRRFAGEDVTVSTHPGAPHAWRVFSFATKASPG